jgi:hypothetical protein
MPASNLPKEPFLIEDPVRLAFCHVMRPQFYDERTGKFRDPVDSDARDRLTYRVQFLFDADSPTLNTVKTLAGQLLDKHGEFIDKSTGQPIPRANLQLPWEAGETFIARDKRNRGDKATDHEHLVGKELLKANTQHEPYLSVFENGVMRDFFTVETRGMADRFFFPGVFVVGSIVVALHAAGTNKPGVKCYLNHLVSLNKGERLAGSQVPTAEKFAGFIGRQLAVDPTAGQATKQPW